MSRFFPPVLASKQTTKINGEPIKIYFEPSRFNSWSEIKHVQLNLYDVESNTNLLSGPGTLIHKNGADGKPLYIQPNGTVSNLVTAQPYLVSSSALSLLLFSSSEILTDDDGKYVVIPSNRVPVGKLVKTQIRLSSSEIPETSQITPSWIANELAMGRLSEWSSPSVFRIIATPKIEWVESFVNTKIAFPTFYFSASSDEIIYRMTCVLNSETIERKTSAWSITESFEFKTPCKVGVNNLSFKIETEGGLTLSKDYSFNYENNGREPSYYVSDYKTVMGSLELTIVDESRTNVFPYKPPLAPPNTKYVSQTKRYEFTRGNTEFAIMNPKEESINTSYTYLINLTTAGGESGDAILRYDYIDGTSDEIKVGVMTSGKQLNLSSLPPSNPVKPLRYSHIFIRFASSSVQIEAHSVRVSRMKTTPVNDYIIRRASAKTGYELWETVHEFYGGPNSSGVWKYLDNSAQPGVVYKYAILGRDVDGSLSAPGKIVYAISSAESIWVSTENYKFLDFLYDTNISGLRIARREQVVETLGSKYPYIMNSGKIKYKTFSLSGTFFHQIDVNQEAVSGYYYRDVVPDFETQAIEHDIISELGMSWEKNFITERETREALVEELSSINPVLLKSDGEDNMIVRFTNIGLTPRRELGNVIYNFSAQVTEIMEPTIENIKKYNLQNTKVVEINE